MTRKSRREIERAIDGLGEAGEDDREGIVIVTDDDEKDSDEVDAGLVIDLTGVDDL